jgi:hypothetical protein
LARRAQISYRSVEQQGRMRVTAPSTFALLSLVAFQARAENAAIALTWEAPAECPSRDSVVAAVERLVRAAPETPLVARARVTHERDRWIAELRTPSGRRTLEAESCLVLAETAVVILAIAVDPDAADQRAERPSLKERDEPRPEVFPGADSVVPEHQAPPVPQNPPRNVEQLRNPAPDRQQWSASLSLRALLEIGILPGPAAGATLALGVERGIWGAELAGSALLPQDGELDQSGGGGGTFYWFAGHALGCLAPKTALMWHACAGVEVGELIGTGFGVDVPKTGRALWFGPLVTSGARFHLGGDLSLEARAGLALPVPRPPAFGLDALGEVHRPAALSGRAELGIRWH